MIDISEAFGKPDRSKVLITISEIEKYLERNRDEKSRNEELRQKVIHKLNNRSEKYEINSSDYKRIIFFEVLKVISDFGNESSIKISTDEVIDSIVSKLHNLSIKNDDITLTKLKDALIEHGVEICESPNDLKNPGQEEYLRKSVKQLVENHLTEMSWATVFLKADRLLTSNNALKLRDSFSNGAIDHSVHVGYSKLNHRPASMINDSDTPSRATSVDELATAPSTPLIHLQKSRPKPAHRLRHLKVYFII